MKILKEESLICGEFTEIEKIKDLEEPMTHLEFILISLQVMLTNIMAELTLFKFL